VIESSGYESLSDSGSIQAYVNSPNLIQGLWFEDCDIEGNFGTYQGGSFKRVDNLVISRTYAETALFALAARSCFRLESCNASITESRITSDASNTTGVAIVGITSNLRLDGTTVDPDFGGGDVSLLTGSWLSANNEFAYSTTPMRVSKDSTSGLVGGGMVAAAWGRFDGSSGAIQAGYNVASVTRTGTGAYTVNFIKPMPNTKYVAFVNAENGTYLMMGGRANNINNATKFGINTTDTAGSSAVATDARQVSFVVYAEMAA
jgi:hypothetical protein